VDRRKRILVVDDDADVVDVITAILEERGYCASGVTSGAAMRQRLTDGEAVDAIVLDAGIRGEDPQLLALYLKARHLPLVMVSGSHAAMRFAEEHELQLLWKPFLGDELIAALARAIESGEFGQRGT
jgi:DNA-binding NtrC family response regulator